LVRNFFLLWFFLPPCLASAKPTLSSRGSLFRPAGAIDSPRPWPGESIMGKDRKDPPAGGDKQAAARADDRSARKAAALRENLRKRKAQQRGRVEKSE